MTIIDIFTQIVIPFIALVAAGGWFVTYKAHKREKEGEATQAEANGAQAWQSVYTKAFEDADKIAESLRQDRDVLKKERDEFMSENAEMRKKFTLFEDQISALKKDVARNARKVEALTPIVCWKFNCIERIKYDPSKKKPSSKQKGEEEQEEQ